MITFSEAELRVKIIKAMAHPVRLMVIEYLKEGDHSFSEILGLFPFDKSTISKHLLVMKDAGILSSTKTGTEVRYRLEVPCVTNFFNCATLVIENNISRQMRCLCK